MKIEEAIKQAQFRDPQQRAHVNLIFTHNYLQAKMMRQFKEFDLTLPQFNILRILRGQHPNPASVSLLVERMLDKMSNASRIVDKLLEKGLVSRRECPRDRRLVDILITDQGLDLLRRVDTSGALDNLGLDNLTATEADTLSYLLDKLRG